MSSRHDRPDGDDRLSAYLDGELDEAETAALEAELADSPDLQAELEATATIRSGLRSLPEVEPPAGFYQRLLDEGIAPGTDRTAEPSADDNVVPLRRRRSAPRRLLPAIAAVAAAWFVVLAFGAGSPVTSIVPPLDDYVARHGQAAAQGAGMGFVETDGSGMPKEGMGEMAMTAEYSSGTTVHAVYGDGERRISIFRQPGEVDFADLPAGTPMMMGETPAWAGDIGDAHIIVINKGTTAFTIVGQEDGMDDMDAMDIMLDEADEDESVGDRLRRAAHDVVRTIGLG